MPFTWFKRANKFKSCIGLSFWIPDDPSFGVHEITFRELAVVFEFFIVCNVFSFDELAIHKDTLIHITIFEIEITFNWHIIHEISNEQASVRKILFSFTFSNFTFRGLTEVPLINKEWLFADIFRLF
jgi:hypothetical protein